MALMVNQELAQRGGDALYAQAALDQNASALMDAVGGVKGREAWMEEQETMDLFLENKLAEGGLVFTSSLLSSSPPPSPPPSSYELDGSGGLSFTVGDDKLVAL